MSASESPWLDAEEAIALLGVSRATLYAYVSRGRSAFGGRGREHASPPLFPRRHRAPARANQGAPQPGNSRRASAALGAADPRVVDHADRRRTALLPRPRRGRARAHAHRSPKSRRCCGRATPTVRRSTQCDLSAWRHGRVRGRARRAVRGHARKPRSRSPPRRTRPLTTCARTRSRSRAGGSCNCSRTSRPAPRTAPGRSTSGSRSRGKSPARPR